MGGWGMATVVWTVILGIIIVWGIIVLWLVTMGYSLGAISPLDGRRLRKQIWCASMGRNAEVEFCTGEGGPYDVADCSLWDSLELDCGKHCLKTVTRAA